MSLTTKQLEYLQNCNHRWNVKVGAVGSGKSYVDIAVTIPKRILAAKGDGILVLMGNTRSTLDRNILEPMRSIWPGLVGNIRANNTVQIFGKKVYALGADKKSQVDRIQGTTMEYVYGDEVTTWSQEVFDMLKSRLRLEHSCFDGTCNPAGPSHWMKQFLDSNVDVYEQDYKIDDGVLPESIIEELKREYAGTVYYDRLILGAWCQAQGLVYPMFTKDNITHEHGTEGEWYLSVDYGTSHPTAAGLWRIHNGTATMEAEYYYDGRKNLTQKTDEDYYDDLARMVEDVELKKIIVDPAAASFKATIKKHHRYHVLNADNSVLDGIRFTATMISQGRIKIHASCENALREFQEYRWNEKSAEDAVIKENDHAMDEMRYLVMTMRHKFTQQPYSPIYMR